MTKEEIATLQGALAGVWPFLRPWLDSRKEGLIVELISVNNDETRGRIKELQEILDLPHRLQSEAIGFQQVQQEEGLS